MQLKSVKLTMGIILETVTVSPEGAFAMKNQNKCLKHIYLNYWQSYWAEKGTKMTGRGQFLSFQVNHVVLKWLKTKNIENLADFCSFWLFLKGFWPLAALKPRGRPGSSEIQIF